MYITQIKPLESGDYESVSKRTLQHQIMRVTIKKKNERSSEPLSKKSYDVVFHVYHINQTLGKRGL